MDTFYQRQWLEDLVHTALWEKVISRDENSGPVYDPPREIRCNIQDISLARALSLQERGVNINYEVGVAGDQDINNDDRLTRAMDRFGTLLFPQAVVIRVVNYDDRRAGRVGRLVYCQLQ